jgi:Mlc titration factor MtfA (ptsG expression regulator)
VLLSWWRKRRRRKITARPFPEAWHEILADNVRIYAALSEEQQAFVRRYTQIFVAEKYWEGCRGQVITDEVRVTIAAHVAILGLGLKDQHFDHLITILVYPAPFVVREGGTKSSPEWEMAADGVVNDHSAVVLAWPEVLSGGRGEDDGNVVFHEFAHQYDRLEGGAVDGTPPLESAEQYRRWKETTDLEFRQLKHRCFRRLPTLLNCYAATDRREFFAVATETFLTRPQAFRRRMPELYQLLSEIFRLDPAIEWPEDDPEDEYPYEPENNSDIDRDQE